MTSTKNSLLKHLADVTGINAKFSKVEEDIIDKSLENIVSPVEATLFNCGYIDGQGFILSKHGKKVALNKLIGEHSNKFNDGIYLNLYLSPKNKHYFRLPYGGNVKYIQKNDGEALIPIIIGLDNLFGNQHWFSKAAKKNASIGIVVDAGKFSYAMIAVGSLNVNNITVECRSKKKYEKGAYTGYFSVGSTIILCFDKSFKKNSELLIKNGDPTIIGTPIIKINPIYTL